MQPLFRVTRNDVTQLPAGGVSILYNVKLRADESEAVVRAGRVPERRLTLLLSIPFWVFGVGLSTIVCWKKQAFDASAVISLLVIGAVCWLVVWLFFAFAAFLQSLRQPVLVIDRLNRRVTAPRHDKVWRLEDTPIAVIAYCRMVKGREHVHEASWFGPNRAYSRDAWVTEIGLLTDEGERRYTPLWQRRVGRWFAWAAPNATVEGVAQQLRHLHEATNLPTLVVKQKQPEPLLCEGVEWNPAGMRTEE